MYPDVPRGHGDPDGDDRADGWAADWHVTDVADAACQLEFDIDLDIDLDIEFDIELGVAGPVDHRATDVPGSRNNRRRRLDRPGDDVSDDPTRPVGLHGAAVRGPAVDRRPER